MPYRLLLLLWLPTASALVQHDLEIWLEPTAGRIRVENVIELASPTAKSFCFMLQAGLNPKLLAATGKLHSKPMQTGGAEQICLDLPPDTKRFTLSYSGPLRYPEITIDASTAPPVSPQGAYLDGNAYWYPHIADELLKVRLKIHMPIDWRAVSQGQRLSRTITANSAIEIWQESQPQTDLYLIATTFHEYQGTAQPAQALTFLRQADAELAQRYLDATTHYLNFYQSLLGPYPYAKFALVENFWDSGYGMPSFTLLGPNVIRLPFILHSSYPHEIVHNWWGNSVYVDYASGNWSEGLTSYLADYLIQEQRGQANASAYRRSALQRYANYVHSGRDFPLREFTARHSQVSQAVGYDKTLMFFHILRQQLGDADFIEGLQTFYRDHKFQRAGFADIQQAFEAASQHDLSAEFEQWLSRTGAPSLQLSDVQSQQENNGFRLSASLTQTQSGPAYHLRVPLAVQLAEQENAWQTVITLDRKQQRFDLQLPAAPERLAIDPAFDLMRRLHRAEIPPALSQLFGAADTLILLPAAAPPTRRSGYASLAARWQTPENIKWDKDITELPSERSIWLFGWDNHWRDKLAADVVWLDQNTLAIDEQIFPRTEFGLTLVARHPNNVEHAIAWLAWDDPQSLAAMARKLPHYGQYGYLAFDGDSARNVLKGQWQINDSPLNIAVDPLTLPAWRATLAPRAVLGVEKK